MSNIISRDLKRTTTYLQAQLETKKTSFNNICQSLAREFEHEDGPHFETSSSEGIWRSLKATIKVFEENLSILLEIEKAPEGHRIPLLKTFFYMTRNRLEHEEAFYKSICRDLAEDFRREGGPRWGQSSNETEWRLLKASIRAKKEILEKLFEVEEIVKDLGSSIES